MLRRSFGALQTASLQRLLRQALQVPGSGPLPDLAVVPAPSIDANQILAAYELASTAQDTSGDLNVGQGRGKLEAIFASGSAENSRAAEVETRDAISLVLRCYGSVRRVDDARRLFQRSITELAADDVTPALFDTFLAMLAQQATVSRAEVAHVLGLMTRTFKLQPTAQTYQSLFEIHLRLFEDCSALWFRMLEDGVQPSPAVLRLLVHGAILPGHEDIRFVLGVVKQFVERCEQSDTCVLEKLYPVLVNHRDAAPEHALWLLFELEVRCVLDRTALIKVVDRASLIRLLYKCARAGDGTSASRILALMERQQIPATADALSLTAWSYAGASEVEKAVDTLEDMATRGMLDGVDHTKRYVIEAINQPVPKHFLLTVAECFNTPDAIDRAFFHLEKRHAESKAVSVHTLDLIVMASAKIGDEGRAVETMESYAGLGVHPRAQSYNALLLLAGGRAKARQHRTIFEAMLRNGVKPNYHTIRLLIRQAVLCDNIDEALEFLEKAPAFHGVRIDVEMLLPILERAARVGDADTVLEVCNFSLKCDIGIDGTVLRTAVARLRESGADPKAIEEMIPVHEQLRGQYGVGRRGRPAVG
jgi:hypothetical protein